MLFGQLFRQSGLRSIQHGLNKQRSSFYHLVEKLPNKQDKHGFRFKNPLYSIDATTIDLCLSLFDWAEFRNTKAGIIINVKLYSFDGYLQLHIFYHWVLPLFFLL